MTNGIIFRVVLAACVIATAAVARGEETWTDKCRTLAQAPFEPGEQGGVALERLDAEEAVPACFRAVAEAGTGENLYRLGRSLEKAGDLAGALDNYAKAQAAGSMLGEYGIAHLYYEGVGVPQDYGKAIELFRGLAERGASFGQYALGTVYETGLGASIDLSEAVRWYRKAAAQGDPRAQSRLGYLYATGKGVKIEPGRALSWYRKAAKQGDAAAQNIVGAMYFRGTGTLPSAELAVHWFAKAAVQGNVYAMYNLGIAFETGKGVDRDLEKSAAYYDKVSHFDGDPSLASGAREALDRVRKESRETVSADNGDALIGAIVLGGIALAIIGASGGSGESSAREDGRPIESEPSYVPPDYSTLEWALDILDNN